MNDTIPSFLLTSEQRTSPSVKKKIKNRLSFIDGTLKRMGGFITTGYLQGETATRKGFFQRLDARAKVIFLIWFLVLVSLKSTFSFQVFVFLLLVVLFVLSHIRLFYVYKRILIFSFLFGFVVIAPAALNIVTDGKMVITLFHFQGTKQFWIYTIPSSIGITREGLMVVTRLCLKVTNSIALTLLISYTTPFVEIIKALKIFRVPEMFLLIITLSYKFIFILARTVQETYFALKLRWWRKVKYGEADKIVAGRIVHLFRKSWLRYEEVFRAMIARGFTGKVNLCYLEKVSKKDVLFVTFSTGVGIVFFILL